MSIINDALKKAGEEKGAAASLNEHVGEIPEVRQENKESSPNASLVPEKVKTRGLDSLVRSKQKRINQIAGKIFLFLSIIVVLTVLYRKSTLLDHAKVEPPKKITIEQQESTLPFIKSVQKSLSPIKETASPASVNERLTLHGIVYGEGEPFAIINNRIVKEGDVIEGGELIEISPDQTKLRFEGKEIVIKVK